MHNLLNNKVFLVFEEYTLYQFTVSTGRKILATALPENEILLLNSHVLMN